ncbi:MAG: PAS domain S-box protein [Gammaproteobacteria bacterium]|nr:PAS domain S-box protein [Gammaproteobacteria bacterium]
MEQENTANDRLSQRIFQPLPLNKPADVQQELEQLRRENAELRNNLRGRAALSERLKALYDEAPTGYLTLDSDHSIIEANLALAQLLNLKRSQLIGQNIHRFIVDDGYAIFQQHLQNVREQTTTDVCELRMKDSRGDPFYARLESITVGTKPGDAPAAERRIIRCNLCCITQHKREAQRALHLARERAQTYLELADSIIIALDAGGQITLINQKGCRVLGDTKPRLIGVDWFECFVPDETRAVARRNFHTLLKDGQDVWGYHEHPITTHAGIQRLLAWNSAIRIDEQNNPTVLLVGDDITARRETENELHEYRERLEEKVTGRTTELTTLNQQFKTEIQRRKITENNLRESQSQYAAIMDALPDMVCRLSANGVILDYHAPPSHHDVLGAGTCIDQPLEAVYPAAVARQWRRKMRAARSQNEITIFEYPLSEVSGGEQTYEARMIDCRDGGVLVVARNITRRKTARAELLRHREQLEELVNERTEALKAINNQLRQEINERKQAEETTREHQEQLAHASRLTTVGEMTSGLAHEINQPLAAIATYTQGCLYRVRAGDDPAVIENILEQVVVQAQRAAKIVQHLRNFVTKGKPHREPTELAKVVALAVSMVRNDIIKKEIELDITQSESLPVVEADPIQVEQVIMNLLRNACEAMNEIEPESRRLHITLSCPDSHHVCLAIRDTGTGIASSDEDKISTPFFSTKDSGMGLGLAISRTIVEDHGGNLTHGSNPDGGATFKFTLAIGGRRT